MNLFQRDSQQSSGKMHWVVLHAEQKLQFCEPEHWSAHQHFVAPTESFICCFQSLQIVVFGPVSQTFAGTHSMAPSAFAFAWRFQLSEYQHVPDPFTHSFFTFGTCLWTFKTLILVRSIKSSSNKQRRLCISWQTNNHAQQSFASATWWNKMEKVAKLSLLTIN